MEVSFGESTADVRLAQYESGSRTPKADLMFMAELKKQRKKKK